MSGLGLYYLDPVLLVHHNVGEGWVSNVYTDPHQSPGGRNQNSYYADVYYTYQDSKGESYRRKATHMGTGVNSGDRFTVLYHPENPSRHLPLTIWGFVTPFAPMALGIACCVVGFRQCREKWDHQLLLRRLHHRKEEAGQASELLPLIDKAAGFAVRQAAGESNRAIAGWLELSSPSDPHQHSLYYVFATDEELREAQQDGMTGRIHEHTFTLLKQSGYPDALLGKMVVLFSSIESIKRDFGEAALARIRS